jgi:hypothetical protein
MYPCDRATEVKSWNMLKDVDAVHEVELAFRFMREAGSEAFVVYIVSCMLLLYWRFVYAHNRRARMLEYDLSS